LARDHREITEHFTTLFIQNPIMSKISFKPPHEQKMTSHQNFRKITFRDMDLTEDHVMNGFTLNVTIVDVPSLGPSSWQFLIEDENGDIQNLSLYNTTRVYDQIKKSYDVGTKIKVFNPYIRCAADGSVRIRIDDPKTVQAVGKVNKICRYCGVEDSKFNCSKCKSAFYCSQECQLNDWKQAGHKTLCNLKLYRS